jgi:hypothetical protein
MSPVGSFRVIMKDKLDEYGERLPKDADGKYVTLLSKISFQDVTPCSLMDKHTLVMKLEVTGSSERCYENDDDGGGDDDDDDEGSRILRHVRTYLPDYTAIHPTELVLVVTVGSLKCKLQ